VRDYFSELDAIIKNGRDVLLGGGILAELAGDADALQEKLANILELVRANSPEAGKLTSEAAIVLRSIAEQKLNHQYLPAISWHAPGVASSVANHLIYSVLTPINRAVSIDRYSLPEGWNCEVFDPSVQLSHEERFVLRPGEVLEIVPNGPIFGFRFSEETILLKLQSTEIYAPFEWSFDSTTYRAWQIISAEPKDSYAHHLCMAAKGLRSGQFGPSLARLLAHDQHHVRWAAAQALGGISRDAGVDALRRLTQDKHPHLARNARQILEKLNIHP
jgi:hypothetical protein